jgi:hypothetical protein
MAYTMRRYTYIPCNIAHQHAAYIRACSWLRSNHRHACYRVLLVRSVLSGTSCQHQDVEKRRHRYPVFGVFAAQRLRVGLLRCWRWRRWPAKRIARFCGSMAVLHHISWRWTTRFTAMAASRLPLPLLHFCCPAFWRIAVCGAHVNWATAAIFSGSGGACGRDISAWLYAARGASAASFAIVNAMPVRWQTKTAAS